MFNNKTNKTQMILGKEWYFLLSPTPNERGLLNHHYDLERHLVVCYTPNKLPGKDQLYRTEDNKLRHLFAYFDSYTEFYQYADQIPKQDHHFFEVIFGNIPQKPHFDIDIGNDDINVGEDIDQIAKILYQAVIQGCIEVLAEVNIKLNLKRDVLLYNSHGTAKRSFHLVITNWLHGDNKEAKAFYERVKAKVSILTNGKYLKFIDGAVYGSGQQFRLLGSQKIDSGRPKRFMELFEFNGEIIQHEYPEVVPESVKGMMQLYESLVSFISGSQLLPPFASEEKIVDYSQFATINITESTINNCMNLMRQKINNQMNANSNKRIDYCPFKFRGIKNNMILSERLRPSYCPLCNKCHDKQDPLMFILNGKVYWTCNRAKQYSNKSSLQLGYLPNNLKIYNTMEIVDEQEEDNSDEDDESNNYGFSFGGYQLGHPEFNIVTEMNKLGNINSFISNGKNIIDYPDEFEIIADLDLLNPKINDKNGLPRYDFSDFPASIEQNSFAAKNNSTFSNMSIPIIRKKVEFDNFNVSNISHNPNKTNTAATDKNSIIGNAISCKNDHFSNSSDPPILSKNVDLIDFSIHNICNIILKRETNCHIKISELFDIYQNYCKTRMFKQSSNNLTSFMASLKNDYSAERRQINGERIYRIHGFKLRDDYLELMDKAFLDPVESIKRTEQEIIDDTVKDLLMIIEQSTSYLKGAKIPVGKLFEVLNEYCDEYKIINPFNTQNSLTIALKNKTDYKINSRGYFDRKTQAVIENRIFNVEKEKEEARRKKESLIHRIEYKRDIGDATECNKKQLLPIKEMLGTKKDKYLLSVRAPCGMGKTKIIVEYLIDNDNKMKQVDKMKIRLAKLKNGTFNDEDLPDEDIDQFIERETAEIEQLEKLFFYKVLFITNRVSLADMHLNDLKDMGYEIYYNVEKDTYYFKKDYKTPSKEVTIIPLPKSIPKVKGSLDGFIKIEQKEKNMKEEKVIYKETIYNIATDKYITQIDSLYKIGNEKYDLLVMDEVTYTLEHLVTFVKYKKRCNDTLERLIKETNKVIVADALIDQNYINYFKLLGRENDIISYYYTHQPYLDKTYTMVKNEAELRYQIMEALERGEKIVVPTNIEAFAFSLKELITNTYPDKKIKLYTGKNKDEQEHDNIIKEWDQLDCLIYSPTIVCGISYVGNNFNKIFAYFSKSSCGPTLAVQMLFRCRAITTMIICVEGKFNTKLCCNNDKVNTLDQYKMYIEGRCVMVNDIEVFDNTVLQAALDTNNAYFYLYCLVHKRIDEGARYYIEILSKCLRETGIQYVDPNDEDESLEKTGKKANYTFKVQDIKIERKLKDNKAVAEAALLSRSEISKLKTKHDKTNKDISHIIKSDLCCQYDVVSFDERFYSNAKGLTYKHNNTKIFHKIFKLGFGSDEYKSELSNYRMNLKTNKEKNNFVGDVLDDCNKAYHSGLCEIALNIMQMMRVNKNDDPFVNDQTPVHLCKEAEKYINTTKSFVIKYYRDDVTVFYWYQELKYKDIIKKILDSTFGIKFDCRKMILKRLFRYIDGQFYPPAGEFKLNTKKVESVVQKTFEDEIIKPLPRILSPPIINHDIPDFRLSKQLKAIMAIDYVPLQNFIYDLVLELIEYKEGESLQFSDLYHIYINVHKTMKQPITIRNLSDIRDQLYLGGFKTIGTDDNIIVRVIRNHSIKEQYKWLFDIDQSQR